MGHSARKLDAEEAWKDLREIAVTELVQRELKALRTLGQYKEARQFQEPDEYVSMFDGRLWRRPLFLILGETNLGKSMLAGRILERIGEALGLTPPAFVEVTVEDDGQLDFS